MPRGGGDFPPVNFQSSMVKKASKRGGGPATRKPATSVVNPFEKRPTSMKYNVLGKIKNNKAHSKSVAVARSEAFEERKKTILVEALHASKSNKFVDRRFAEDQNIPEEDKMIMRFQRERVARARKGGSAFNIDEEEDDDEIITHQGVAIRDIVAFKGDDFGGSDSDDDALGRDTVKDYNFGGFQPVEPNDEDPERVKSKREVMQEIIAKSKMHKAEKRREKAEREDLIDQLNADFNDISDLLSSKMRPKVKVPKEKVSRAELKKAEKSRLLEPLELTETTDFDSLTKELAVDLKARPSDRLKTPEDIAKEEYERLQRAEKERIKRMTGPV